MEYLLFTYPNCSNCEKLKDYLSEIPLDWQEYDLVQKESKMKIRDFLADIKRDESGGIIIPTLIAQDDGVSKAVLNSREELDDWLKSKE
jgi:glutaredoxin